MDLLNAKKIGFQLRWTILFIGLYWTEATNRRSGPVSCDDALGLENGALRSDQFSASSIKNEQNVPHEARLNDGGVGWIASGSDKLQYLKIDLEGTWNISKLSIQGAMHPGHRYTKQLRITYSLDDLVWYPYNSHRSDDMLGEILQANDRHNEVKNITLDPPIRARYVAFNPYEFSIRPALRLELYGCFLTNQSRGKYITLDQDIEDVRTFIPSQSPVIVNSVITIRPSGSLIIQAGVSVIFTAPEAGFSVFGTLNTTGVNGVPVLFSGDYPVLDIRTSWDGIKTEGMIAMEYTVVRQSSTGISGAGEGISIRKSVFHSCNYGLKLFSGQGTNDRYLMAESKLVHNTYGIDMHGKDVAPYLRFFKTDFFQSTYSGIRVINWDRQISESDAHTKLYLSNCRLCWNLKHGLESTGNIFRQIVIRDSSISQNFQEGINIHGWFTTADNISIVISSTDFVENKQHGIKIMLHYTKYAKVTLRQNNFTGNGFREVYAYMYLRPRESLTFLEIKNNLFTRHTSSYYPLELQTESWGSVFLDVENNTFFDTHGCIYLNSEDELMQVESYIRFNRFMDIYGLTKYVVISSNVMLTFTHNAVQNVSTSTVLEVRTGLDHSILYNNFTSVDSVSCLLSVRTPFNPEKSIFAPRNFWGSDNLQTIKMKICDFFLDASVARVKFMSYFSDSSLDRKSLIDIAGEDAMDTQAVSQNYWLIGGIMQERVDLTDQNTSYIVFRSIIIEDSGLLLLSRCKVTFKERRGIVVKGQAAIGEDDDMKDITFLQSFRTGTIWNGFYIYGGQLTVVNSHISDAKDVITVKIPYKLGVRTVQVDKSDNFINALYLNGNLSLLVESSWFDLNKEAVLVKLNNTDTLNIRFFNSSLRSRSSQIVSITDSRSRKRPLMTVTLELDNCTLLAGSSQSVYIRSCYVDFIFRAFRSKFSSSGYSEHVYTHVETTTADVSQCKFTNGGRRLFYRFCGKKFENLDSERYINILNNTFSTKMFDSEDIYYYNYRYDRDHHVHTFNLENNVFKQTLPGNKQGFRVYCRRHYIPELGHNIFIRNNTFQGYETALVFDGAADTILISHNLFLNNSCVLKLHQRDWTANVVNFTLNVIHHHNADGILQLQLYRLDHYVRTHVEGNVFENNSGSVITISTPFIYLQKNFFENPDASYNLKIVPDGNRFETFLNASLNYWGSIDLSYIQKQIYDVTYDKLLFDVVCRPYLGSKNVSDVRDEDAQFFILNGKIGGSIRNAVTLTFEDSPFIVTSNIEILEGSLTMEAGVTVHFMRSLGISVLGSLLAYGNASHPIQLLSQNPDEKWRGLDFKASRGDTESTLRHVIVNNTLTGITIDGTAFKMKHVTSSFSNGNGFEFNRIPTNSFVSEIRAVQHIYASNNTKCGIVVQLKNKESKTINFEIGGCLASGNGEHGINVNTNATITVYQCSIMDNGLSGVFVLQHERGSTNIVSCNISMNHQFAINVNSTQEILIEYCQICNHNYGSYEYMNRNGWHFDTRHYIQISRNQHQDLRIIMKRNMFYNNRADGIGFYVESYDDHDNGNYSFIVQNNMFYGGNRTLFVEDVSRQYAIGTGHILISNNTFINITESIHQIMYFDVRAEAFHFDNNKVITCTTPSIIRLTGQANIILPATLTIYRNEFQNNTVQSTITIASLYYTDMLISENIFTNMETDCGLNGPAFLNFSSAFFINATYNYWGASSSKTVVEKVCGFEKNMTKAVIYYIPYYTNVELNEIETYGQDDFDVSGALGGEITGEVVLTKHYSPYIISRSLMIRNNSQLLIDDGTVLKFKPGRGIYALGSLISKGRKASSISLKSLNDSRWYGIVINSTFSGPSVIEHTGILGTQVGVIAQSPSFVMSSCNISDSIHAGLSMSLRDDGNTYDFAETTIEHMGKYGILLHGHGTLTLLNITVRNVSNIGIFLDAFSGHLTLAKITIKNCSKAAEVYFSSIKFAGNFTMRDCNIINNVRGISVRTQSSDQQNLIDIQHNYFINNAGETLTIIAPYYPYSFMYHWYPAVPQVTRLVDIGYNYFENSGDIVLQTWNYMNLTFHDNTVIASHKPESSNKCMLHTFGRGSRNLRYRRFDITTNVFRTNEGDCIVYLDTSDYELNGTFSFNQLLSNKVKHAVLKINTLHFDLFQNLFDNPESSFDVYVTRMGQGSICAANNWWGSATIDVALSRIFDFRKDLSLLYVNATPILTDKTFDCSGTNDCSRNGDCVRPNGCRCYSGWMGLTCGRYDCAGVNNCSDNGLCIGPNKCDCHDGWIGDQCTHATCTNVNDCSGHGICVQPNVCTCADDFTGRNCSACVEFHWGPLCELCPNCVNGFCDLKTGLCICNGINWTGYLCDTCGTTFYGPDCLPLMMALNLVPSQGRDTGNYNVHVWGHNFPETQDKAYLCKFGSTVVNGTWKAWNHVICAAPALPENHVVVEVSPNGTSYTSNMLFFTFYATCPPGACGRDMTPPRGQCIFGRCSCNLPWIGDDCTIELLDPVIANPPSEFTVPESSSFHYKLNLTQGSPPYQWSLVASPENMKINEGSGLVYWDDVPAGKTPYRITVEVRNRIGADSVTWSITAPRSYSAEISSIEPGGIMPVPKPVLIAGTVTFYNGSVPRIVPVALRVYSHYAGRISMLHTLTNPQQESTWTATYYPRPNDVGAFEVTASHPANYVPAGSGTWSYLGMRCYPNFLSLQEIIDGDVTILSNISKLVNIGESTIPAVTATVYGLNGAFIRKSDSRQNTSTLPLIDRIGAGQEVHFDLVIPNAQPLSDTIYIAFISDDGTSTRLGIYISLSIRRPFLVFNPSILSGNILRGTQKLFDVKLMNQGEVIANNVGLDLPTDLRVSLVSFASKDGADVKELSPGGIAVFVVAITIEATAGLGEMSGSIAVNSDMASGVLKYRFFITSIQHFDLTFDIKDEYTYFASGAPLVAGAFVKLTNPIRGYSESRHTTNETGYVTFEAIYEDQYTLYASADSHASYSAVILATPETSRRDIFLQRVAVTYTWSVTRTTVEDTYVITLDSTFETLVPMPVVTIEPAKINTIPYELGEHDTIKFTITNHGLIRADNLRLDLPKNHPVLKFESTIDGIGSIDANTSVIVPVKVTINAFTKRSGVCSMPAALFYTYPCDGIKTVAVGIIFTRESPLQEFTPCFNPTGRYYSGTSGSRSISYKSGTSVSCECLKTLIQSCILPWIPFAAHALAFEKLLKSDSPQETMGAVLEIIGLTIVSGIGYVFKPLDIVIKVVPCVVALPYNCGQASRRKRDISSEVVENLLFAAKPMDNFLNILSESFGDEEMYKIDETWFDAFKAAISDESHGGALIFTGELNAVLDSVSDKTSKTTINKFLFRWNNTASALENGTLNEITDARCVISLSKLSKRLDRFMIDMDAAKKKGFDSIFHYFDHAISVYRTAVNENQGKEKDGNVCTKVRVRIVQEFVFTRDAFNARLEIENGETADLEDIKIEIQITRKYGTGEIANDVFSIGAPSLIGISAVDGTGRLGMNLSGSAEWIMIPYSDAASEDDTDYNVGGRLSYQAGNNNFSIHLLPDIITVKPTPSLVVHYFHEKHVQGDDPLTANVVEPIVPFSLAVMVTNDGYGIARALKMSTAQPEIIENEKGLLITFKIIEARIGGETMPPTLTVDFGNIKSFETKTARWLLTSTLKGKFYNFSATFENINPLGDPQLSLLDDFGYHELVHLVRINLLEEDDDLDDFLVNDRVDANGIPDKLYNSANGSDTQTVLLTNVTQFRLSFADLSPFKKYKIVFLKVKTTTSAWCYTRVENNITSPDPADNEYLLRVKRKDGHNVLVDKNAWQTTHILDAFFFHLLDYVPGAEVETVEEIYELTFGPKNMHSPKFNATYYNATMSIKAPLSTFVIQLNAYDLDQDVYTYRLMNVSFMQFAVDPIVGTVTLSSVLLSAEIISFEVLVEDSGIPLRSSSALVIVQVVEEHVANSTDTVKPKLSTVTSASTQEQVAIALSDAKMQMSTVTSQNILPTSASSTMSCSHASNLAPFTDSSATGSPTVTQSVLSTIANSKNSSTSSALWTVTELPIPSTSMQGTNITEMTPTISGTEPSRIDTSKITQKIKTEDITISPSSTSSPMKSSTVPTLITSSPTSNPDKNIAVVSYWVIPTVVGISALTLLVVVIVIIIVCCVFRNRQ